MHGPARAVAKYLPQFPKLSESTVRRWLGKYRKELKNHVQTSTTPSSSGSPGIRIGTKCGRPLSLPEELDAKLRRFITCLREARVNINRSVVYGGGGH